MLALNATRDDIILRNYNHATDENSNNYGRHYKYELIQLLKTIILYICSLSYECHVFGKSFELQWGNFTQYVNVKCLHTALWSKSLIAEPCKCRFIFFLNFSNSIFRVPLCKSPNTSLSSQSKASMEPAQSTKA